MPKATWRPPARYAAGVANLERNLAEIADRRIETVFVDNSSADEAKFAALVEVVRKIDCDQWEAGHNEALRDVMRTAIDRLDSASKSRGGMTWLDLGILLYGFRTDLPDSPGRCYGYSDYVAIARGDKGFEHPPHGRASESSAKRDRSDLRKRLAVSLLELAYGLQTDEKEDEPVNLATGDAEPVMEPHDPPSRPKVEPEPRIELQHRSQPASCLTDQDSDGPPGQHVIKDAGSRQPALPRVRNRRRGPLVAISLLLIVTFAVGTWSYRVRQHTGGPSADHLRPIKVAIQDIRSAEGWSANYDANDQAAIARALDRTDHQPFPTDHNPEFLRAELADGAYLAGSGIIKLALSNSSASLVTITGAHVMNVRRQSAVDGATVVLPTQGQNPDLFFGFDLDDANPVPEAVAANSQTLGAPFFAASHIDVAGTRQEIVDVLFKAASAAYSFDLGLDYVTNGHAGTAIVSLDGTPAGPPFRVTADPCVTAKSSTATAADKARAAAFRFGAVRKMGSNAADTDYLFRALTPDAYAHQCAQGY